MHGNRNDARIEILERALTDFPDSPTMTLAKKLYKEHPEQFVNLESCRAALRYRRGNVGDRMRTQEKSKKHRRPNGKAGFTTALPPTMARPHKPYNLPNGRALVLSDIHVPYHDPKALELALEYGDKIQPDTIYLNGDAADFFSISRWEKNPSERNLHRELVMVREFLCHLRERFPHAEMVYKIGNHEERWEKYMWLKAPEISGLTDFQIHKILDFDRYGIKEVVGKQKTKAGKNLTIIHGHEIFGATAPVNFARTLQTTLGVCTIAGHRHQTSEHSYKTADDKFIHCWSQGCLCDMSPEYAVFNRWNHGFCVVELEGNDFQVDNKRIVDGKVY